MLRVQMSRGRFSGRAARWVDFLSFLFISVVRQVGRRSAFFFRPPPFSSPCSFIFFADRLDRAQSEPLFSPDGQGADKRACFFPFFYVFLRKCVLSSVSPSRWSVFFRGVDSFFPFCRNQRPVSFFSLLSVGIPVLFSLFFFL